eukprot:13907060-Ditylum_brightwellii.AAC.1
MLGMVSPDVVEMLHTDHADAMLMALVADWYGEAMLHDLSTQCCKGHMQQANHADGKQDCLAPALITLHHTSEEGRPR